MVVEYGPLCSVFFFCYINKLRLIPYSVVLCNLSQIDSETFFFVCGFFSRKGFHIKSCVFPLFRISLLCH